MSAGGILVGVCTFRRPSLEDTLRSLLALEAPSGLSLRVAVADNDETPSAAALVRRAAAAAGREVLHLHAPARNISLARNALLAEAERGGERFLAFLDDDEWVEPDWLIELAAAREAAGADAAFGPVRGVYGPDAPGWMRDGAFHDTRPEFDGGGGVRNGYTCNTLLDLASPAFQGRRFDPAFGRSGGEDSAFFEDARRAGARLAPAPRALAFEHVPAERARAAWLARRRFRMGQTHAAMAGRGAGPARRLLQAGLAGGKLAACVALAAAQAPWPEKRNRSLLRGCLHAGVASALLGLRPLILYGAAEPSPGGRAAPGQGTP